jgi:hypothetical protein
MLISAKNEIFSTIRRCISKSISKSNSCPLAYAYASAFASAFVALVHKPKCVMINFHYHLA